MNVLYCFIFGCLLGLFLFFGTCKQSGMALAQWDLREWFMENV